MLFAEGSWAAALFDLTARSPPCKWLGSILKLSCACAGQNPLAARAKWLLDCTAFSKNGIVRKCAETTQPSEKQK